MSVRNGVLNADGTGDVFGGGRWVTFSGGGLDLCRWRVDRELRRDGRMCWGDAAARRWDCSGQGRRVMGMGFCCGMSVAMRTL